MLIRDVARGLTPSPPRSPKLAKPSVAATAGMVLALLILGACGSDDSASDQPAAESGPPGVLEITASDYEFHGVPDEITAGTELMLRNDSSAEVHEVVAIRLPDDEKRSIAEIVLLPPEEFGAFFPLVETVLVAPPGEDGVAVEGTGLFTEPGRYALICVIPTGADPDEYMAAAAAADGGPPDVAGGPPHMTQGMFAELTVVG